MAKKIKFRVVDSHKYLRLGKRNKRKRKYKRPRGGENKIRLNRAGRLRKVKIGFKNKKSERGLIKNLKPAIIYNIQDLKKIKENMIGIVVKIGDKKKKEIAEYALKNKVRLLNLNPGKFLKNIEEKLKKLKEEKEIREKKREVREKEVKEKPTKKEEKEKKEKSDEKLEAKLEEKLEEKTKNVEGSNEEKLDEIEIKSEPKTKEDKEDEE